MVWISDKEIEKIITYPALIEALDDAFAKQDIVSPPKVVHNYKARLATEVNNFLYMPAWDNDKYFGCKLITATLGNKGSEYPYINGVYNLFDAETGRPLVSMDAKLITNYRTAATSALAASKLIRKDAASLLVLGNGAISPYFIKAHLTVHDYKIVYLWGRDKAKSERVIKDLALENSVELRALDDYRDLLSEVDVISCITSAQEALIHQSNLGKGQHLDLAGSFTHDMHEVSSDVITSCSIYTDNIDTTPFHAGEIVKAVDLGVFDVNQIKGDLKYLCQSPSTSRISTEENTLFKSTGMALEDFVIAQLIWKTIG